MVSLPQNHYRIPKGIVVQLFILQLAAEFDGVQERKWNSEKTFIFIAVILQKNIAVKGRETVRKRVSKRLSTWINGEHGKLIANTVRSIQRRDKTNKPKGELEASHHEIIYNQKIMEGNLRMTDRDNGNKIGPNDIDPKTGLTVVEALRKLHPSEKHPKVTDLPKFTSTPPLGIVTVSEESM